MSQFRIGLNWSLYSFIRFALANVTMLRTESDEERLFEHLDKVEAEIEKLSSLGLRDKSLEQIAKRLRISLYSYKRMSSNTMIEVVRTHDQEIFSVWSEMWEQMKEGKVHPRELKAFHDRLVRLNQTP